jgi:cell division protein FtsW
MKIKQINKKKKVHKKNYADFTLIVLTIALVVFGIIMVFSASYYNSINEYGSPYHYLLREIVWAGVGTFLMFVISKTDYRYYKAIAWPGIITSVVLLALLFTPLGITRNYATRWLGIGGLTVMPAEIAKLAIIIFIAYYFSSRPKSINNISTSLAPMLGIIIIFDGLIMLQPNMSTAMIIFGITMSMMFFAGAKWRYFWGILIAGGAGALIFIFFDPDGYRLRRFTSFFDPFSDPLGTGYQVMQSLFAMGSGQVFGVGIGKSIQKNLHLPEAQNDFILAVIGEELGYAGVIALLICYLVLIWKGYEIAINAKDSFGMLLAAGITTMIAIQVILNVLVVTSSMPPTGVTLPFISYGGNALLLFMCSIGILLNISKNANKKVNGGEILK